MRGGRMWVLRTLSFLQGSAGHGEGCGCPRCCVPTTAAHSWLGTPWDPSSGVWASLALLLLFLVRGKCS